MITQPLTPAQADALAANQPRYTITQKDKDRIKQIQAAWKAYEGDLEKPLQPMPDGTDPNVRSNRMAAIVDRGGEFLFGKDVQIRVDEDAPDEAQTFLDSVWGTDESRIPLLLKFEQNGANAGQAFLRIVPEQDEDTGAQTYRIIALDPCTIYIQTAPGDCDKVTLYCIEYANREKRNGQDVDVYYREEITRNAPDMFGNKPFPDLNSKWVINHWSRVGTQGMWTPAGDPILWNYAFPPIFDNQNLPKANDRWGYPDLTPDLIETNKSINLTQSLIQLAELLYGQPILYSNSVGDVVVQLGKIINLGPDGKISSVQLSTDIPSALSLVANLRSDIDEQSAVPGVATGRIADLPRGAISGVAIELMFMPLIKKNDKKKCLYGKTIIDVSQALLVLNGMPNINVSLEWQYPLPKDSLQDIQATIAKQEIGLSQTTALLQIGEDPEKEAELRKQEAQDKLTDSLRGQGLPPASPFPPGLPGVPPLPGQQPPPVPQPAQPQGAPQ